MIKGSFAVMRGGTDQKVRDTLRIVRWRQDFKTSKAAKRGAFMPHAAIIKGRMVGLRVVVL
jgi:hypothetical protein